MEFETLRKDNRKKYIIGAILILAIASVVFFVSTRANYKDEQRLNLINTKVNWTLTDLEIVSIQIKEGDSYRQVDEVPAGNYTVNTIESICKDKSGSKLDTNFEYRDNKVYIDVTKKGTKCSIVLEKSTCTSVFCNQILASNGGESAIKTKGNPDFSKTSCTSGVYNGTSRTCGEDTTGMWAMEDDYGMSYYFRGTPTNNYVKFAGYYWRIIRINGDGTIRMIYDGTAYHANGTNTTNSIAKTSQTFNSSSNDNMYVGYAYTKKEYKKIINENSNRIDGTVGDWYLSSTYTFNTKTGEFVLGSSIDKDGHTAVYDGIFKGTYTCQTTSNTCTTMYKIGEVASSARDVYVSTYTSTLQITNESSNAKTQLDSWYTSSGLSNYASYLSDSGFCGDRSTYNYDSPYAANSSLGTGTSKTRYGAYVRLGVNKIPSLKCSKLANGNKNDVYTKGTANGNGSLTYLIGLISADEALLAGGESRANNYAYYLYNGQDYWSMTPAYFSGSYGNVWTVVYYGGVNSDIRVDNPFGLRPVINLDPTKINNVTIDSQGVYVVS